jgi:hypothetical protein
VTCKHCEIGEDECAYPTYGVAPHKHVGEFWLGSTVMDDKSTWPEHFKEDPECEGLGTYEFCPYCKDKMVW